MDARNRIQRDAARRHLGTAEEPKEAAKPVPAPRLSTVRSDSIDYRTLLENSLDMVWLAFVKDHRHRYVYCTPSTRLMLGYRPDEIFAMGPEQIFTPESMRIIAADVETIAASESSKVVVEAVCKDGRHIWLENMVRAIHKEKDGTLHIAIYMRDVSDRKRLEDKLAEMVFLDGLTGIKNRRAFDHELEREWKRAVRTQQPLSLIMLDVDRFKPFNDTYGHQAGDDCICAVAKAVRDSVKRPEDMVARYGGEELVALLPETDLPGAEKVAVRLCAAVRELGIYHCCNDGRGVVTVSAGVSTAVSVIEGCETMPEALLRAADAALYKAKHMGRDQVATAVVNTTSGEKMRSGNPGV